jgi:transcriptional regulator with GAF, ATPase, and Fis domain
MVSKSPDTTVLFMGKSGTGKELITKTIHDNSGRKNNRMMAVNCTATVQTLIESE